jgi:CRP-like cAMP-binding protein
MNKIVLLKRTFESGQTISKEGDPGGEAYLIREGYITIWKMDGDRKVELATRGPGEIVGEMSLIDDRPRSASVTAKGKVVAEVITRNELKEMLSHSPEPLIHILRQLLERLRDTNELATMNVG